ncbi:NHL domain-containing protein [Flavipsychrobacter stenotrophus]|uniref:NHL domain-containing protein n=1 Tax=Flavipsychrobacter stenotrophus TaxID=2077091 RepID=UPI0010573664|nr:T9SS type A sorting domain-containing protein [Flavipsychrobacter stenotrophus]
MLSPFSVTWHNGDLYISDVDHARIRKIDAAGRISTVVGNGLSVFELPDLGGQATATPFAYPADVAFDSKNNMYISDAGLDCVFKVSPAGIVSRFAGTDTFGYNGDNIPAITATLNGPRGIAIDKDDNIFIADTRNSRIRKVNGAGMISTVMSVYSEDVCVDAMGNLFAVNGLGLFKRDILGVVTCDSIHAATGEYVHGVDMGDNNDILVSTSKRILSINGAGTVTVVAGGDTNICSNGAIATAVAIGAIGIAADHNGVIYICDNYSVHKIESGRIYNVVNPSLNTLCNGSRAENAVLENPSSVTFDGVGNMFISEMAGRGPRVRKVNKDGVISTYSSGISTWDVCASKTGDLFMMGFGKVWKVAANGLVSKYAGSDSMGFSGDGGPATDARLAGTFRSLKLDKDGNLFIADKGRVRKVDNNGIITTVAGNGVTTGDNGDGGLAINAHVAPWGVACDLTGNLYILETHDIRKVAPDGTISTIAGPGIVGVPGVGGPATAAYFTANVNNKIVVDTVGNIYFTDIRSNIRKVSADGIFTTIAGSDSTGFSGDGGPATAAYMWRPMGLSIDDSGRVYFADYGNNRIRRIDTRYKFPVPVADMSGALSIYPNPSTGVLHIVSYSKTPGDVQVLVYDVVGRRVGTQTFSTSTGVINESLTLPAGLPMGTYVLQLITPSGNRTAQFLLAK